MFAGGGDMGPGKTQGESAGGVLQRLEVGSGHFQHFRSALPPFFAPIRADRDRSGDIRERWVGSPSSFVAWAEFDDVLDS